MMRPMITVLILAWAAAVFAAPPPGANEGQQGTSTEPDEILLADGILLLGRIVEEREDVIVFETVSLGRLEIPLANIERIGRSGDKIGALSDPDLNSIMFCPTPATLPKGDSYFRDFELFFLNFGHAISDDLDISFGTLFPISSEVIMVSLGAKLRIADRETQPLGLALTGSFTKLEKIQFGAVGAVAGFGDARGSLNVAVNRTFNDDGDTDTIFIVGADNQISRRSKMFAEFSTSQSIFGEADDDLNGFINIGFRIFGESHSFSLGGFRPLTDTSDNFIVLPMLMFSNHW